MRFTHPKNLEMAVVYPTAWQFVLLNSFPIPVKPLQSAMVWPTFFYIYIYIFSSLCVTWLFATCPIPKREEALIYSWYCLSRFLSCHSSFLYIWRDVLPICSPLCFPCLSFFSSLSESMCNCWGFAPRVVTSLTHVLKIIMHCVWLHHHKVTKYSTLVHL